MPNRILREGILTSRRVNRLKPQAELFYRRLMSVVDDFGRYSADPSLLRASCYPLRLDEVREADISRWLAEVQTAGLIALYAVQEEPYLELLDFRQQVRALRSKYPPPPEDAQQMRSRCVADAEHVRTKAEAEAEAESETRGVGGSRARETTTEEPACLSGLQPPGPSLAEVLAEAGRLGVPPDEATRWHAENEGRGWLDPGGSPIREWRATFRPWAEARARKLGKAGGNGDDPEKAIRRRRERERHNRQVLAEVQAVGRGAR